MLPALGRLRQEDEEFKASLGYSSKTLYQKKKKIPKREKGKKEIRLEK
jgi:hypothetical protein